MEISKGALKRRKFKKDVYDKLCSTTILKILPPIMDPEKVSLDVGGNVGHIAKFLSEHSSMVYTFEPVKVVYDRLLKVAEESENIKVFNVAIGDKVGKAKFFVDHLRLSNSGLQDLGSVKTEFKKSTEYTSVKVNVKTLDSFNFDDVGLIKIDVEGTELDVLKGAEVLIKEQSSDFIIEIYEPFSKYPVADIFAFMFDRGYRCYYYSTKLDSVVEVSDTDDGVRAVRNFHDHHDGDFLFSKKKI